MPENELLRHSNADRSQTPQYAPIDDEVSLAGMLEVVVQKRILVFSVTIVSILIAAGYSFWVKPVYRASTSFLPPPISIADSADIVGLTQGEAKEVSAQLYPNFITKVQSYNFQRSVFESGNFLKRFADNSDISDGSDRVARAIANSISIKPGTLVRENGKIERPTYLEMTGDKPEAMSDYLNALADMAKKSVKKSVQEDIYARLASERRKILNQIDLLQKGEREVKIAKIRGLTEQLALARKHNIKNHNFKQVASEAPQWFVFGADLLEEEINALKSRSDGESNNPEVFQLREQLKALESAKAPESSKLEAQDANSADVPQGELGAMELKAINSSLENFEVAVIVQPSVPPTRPVNKPDLKMAILIGLVVGLVMGVIIAFLSNAISSLRARQKKPAIS